MQKNGLRPRATLALGAVAASLFLLLCLANYGQIGADQATEPAWHLGIAAWFVEVFGIGAYALVVLPFAWGLIVYFREDTPSLGLRAAGTLLLACSLSMLSGLLQEEPGLWAGAVGVYTVALVNGLGTVLSVAVANTLAWVAGVALFAVSTIWATDWMFHTVRKGGALAPEQGRTTATSAQDAAERLATEPPATDLREPGAAEAEVPASAAEPERGFVPLETAGATAAAALATEPADVSGPLPVEAPPEGFSMRRRGDRLVVRGPVGYDGVEFLPPNDELAEPAPAPQHVLPQVEHEERFLDEELAFDLVEQYEREHPEALLADETVLPEAPLEERPTADEAAAETPSPAERTAPEDVSEPTLFDLAEVSVPAAAEQLDAPVVEAPAARPRSGIGLPDDSPFVDEFFAVDVVVAVPPAAGEGASADAEVEAAIGARVPAGESPEAAVAPPVPPAPAAPQAAPGEAIVVDELLITPSAFALLDDELPAAIVSRAAPARAEPEPEPVSEEIPELTAEDEAAAGPDLSRIHGMYLDPLFHDAVDAVLESERGSAMALQRRFGIGHARGLRLLQQMEQAGIVGAEDAAGAREVRVSRAEWEAFCGTRAS